MDKNYLKNTYYTSDIVRDAIIKTREFYKGNFKPKLFKRGNHKLPKNVACWDLPCRVTCKFNCPNCYALKAERLYSNRVPQCRAYHYEIIKQAIKDNKKRLYLLQYMCTELDKHVKYCNKKGLLPVVRTHSSGDIFSKEYLDFLLELIDLNKDIYFYAYTKQLDNELIDKLNNRENLNIVKSIIHIGKKNCLNYGSIDYITKLSNELAKENKDSYICGYGIDDTQKCMVNCNTCLHCPHVLFKQH